MPQNKTAYALVEDSLSMHRTASNETSLMSEISIIINEENVIAPGQGKKSVSRLSDEFCEKQALAYLLPKGKFAYDTPRDISISLSPYFTKGLLNLHKMHIIYFYSS